MTNNQKTKQVYAGLALNQSGLRWFCWFWHAVLRTGCMVRAENKMAQDFVVQNGFLIVVLSCVVRFWMNDNNQNAARTTSFRGRKICVRQKVRVLFW